MSLWAISDLHLNYARNREALADLPDHGDDWLIVAGDLGDTLEQGAHAFRLLARRFGRLLWVPGNHELWTHPKDPGAARGRARYLQWVDLCRSLGVLTPEDEYPLYTGPGGPVRVVPLFLGYDYSFRPDDVPLEGARAWAAEHGLMANDERYLHPDPYPDLPAWCAARLETSRARLDALAPDEATVLVNHYPLRHELVRIPRIQRFSIWCGTRATEDWHTRYRARVVVVGHLHVRTTDWRDGTRFEEVALGYPRHWDPDKGLPAYLRRVLPDLDGPPPGGHGGPVWHR